MIIENVYMLKLYLKRILTIKSIIREYTNISDIEIIKKLQRFINLYLNELYHFKNELMELL